MTQENSRIYEGKVHIKNAEDKRNRNVYLHDKSACRLTVDTVVGHRELNLKRIGCGYQQV